MRCMNFLLGLKMLLACKISWLKIVNSVICFLKSKICKRDFENTWLYTPKKVKSKALVLFTIFKFAPIVHSYVTRNTKSKNNKRHLNYQTHNQCCFIARDINSNSFPSIAIHSLWNIKKLYFQLYLATHTHKINDKIGKEKESRT